MIFRLRGVALFNDQFVAYQPSGNGRYGQTRWLSLAGLGGSEANVLTRGAAGVERGARRRHAHCKFIVVAPGRSILLKNSRRFKIANRAENGALILKLCTQSRKTGAGFQPVSPTCAREVRLTG